MRCTESCVDYHYVCDVAGRKRRKGATVTLVFECANEEVTAVIDQLQAAGWGENLVEFTLRRKDAP